LKALDVKRPQVSSAIPRVATIMLTGARGAASANIAMAGADFASLPIHAGSPAVASEDMAATNANQVPCMRFYLPYFSRGLVHWTGIPKETLDADVRVLTEDDKKIEHANAGGYDTIEAIYFGHRYGFFILKVPDHCTAVEEGSLSTSPASCCNTFGRFLARKKGKAEWPRPGTEAEFGVKNDWDKPAPKGGSK
jgi:hypothetical protein